MKAARKNKPTPTAERASGTHRSADSIKQHIEQAIGSDGSVSISAAAIESMSRELHGATWLIGGMVKRLKSGILRRHELDELALTIAQIAHRARAVAKLERELAARAREGGA